MPTALDLDALDLDTLASPRILRRGRQYARQGHVLDWRVSGERLEARVQGLSREPYLLSVEWDGEELLPACTCPFEGEPFCKHAIAALVMATGGPPAPSGEADDEEWVPPEKPRRAEELQVRRTRGRKEAEDGLTIRNLDGDRYYGRFEVEPSSGRVYRVEIRSLGQLMNHCDCPDFHTNLLGTCKHVEAVIHRLRRRAPKKTARLAKEVPAVTFVYVGRTGEPRIRVQRGARMGRRLAEFVERHFDPSGTFTGDPATDFPAFRREAQGHRRLVVGEDAVEFAAQCLEEEAGRARRGETEAAILRGRGRIEGVSAELFPYQTQGVAFLAGAGRAILADDMGLGKTVQAIGASRWLMENEGVRRVLVFCPASLKHQWKREIERFAGLPVTVVQGGVPERNLQYREGSPFTIVNYELALRDDERIRELAPDVLVLDEAQRIKNWRAKTAAAIKDIRTRYAFVLTGTPVENRLDDLYSLMQVVDPRILGPLWAFNERFVNLSPKGHRVHGYRNLGRLREILRPVFLRRDRAQVLSQLPERSDSRYYVEMTKKQRDYMDENVQTALMLLRRAEKRPLSPSEHKRLMAAFQRARMACDAAGLVDKETRGSPKLDEFARVVEEMCIQSGRKVVVFSEWEQMIRRAAERAGDLGIEHVILSGSVPTKKRGPLIDRFREDPDVRIFFSTDAGGLGLNLQAAQTVVNLDLPWNPARLEQRIARVHRMGQRSNVNVVLLIAENSIEHRIEAVLEAKRDLFDAVVTADSNVEELSTRPKTLRLIREVVSGNGEGPAASERPSRKPASPDPEEVPATAVGPGEGVPTSPAPAGAQAAPVPDPVRRLEEALGYRLREVKRTRAGRLVAVVDRRDPAAERIVREAAGSEVVVLDAGRLAALEAFGEESPLAGAETLRAARADEETADRRAEDLSRLARRRLEAARKLADAGMGAEALKLASEAAQARVRAGLSAGEDAETPDALLRAVYERLLPAGKVTVEEAGALGRIGDLARAYGGGAAEPPAPIVSRALEEAAAIVED